MPTIPDSVLNTFPSPARASSKYPTKGLLVEFNSTSVCCSIMKKINRIANVNWIRSIFILAVFGA